MRVNIKKILADPKKRAELIRWVEGFLEAQMITPPPTVASPEAKVQFLGHELKRVREQIKQLADFIMENIPGEPSKNEGAVECAIRLLKHSKRG